MQSAGPCDRFVSWRLVNPRGCSSNVTCGTSQSLRDQAATRAMRSAGPCDRFEIRRLLKPCCLRDHAIASRSGRHSSHAVCGTMRSLCDHAATQAMRPAGPCACFVITRRVNPRGHSMHAASQEDIQAMRSARPCNCFVITWPLKPCGLRNHAIAS